MIGILSDQWLSTNKRIKMNIDKQLHKDIMGSAFLEKYEPILEKVKNETDTLGNLAFLPSDMKNVIYSLYFWKYLINENYSNRKLIKLSDDELATLTNQFVPEWIVAAKDVYKNDYENFDFFCKSYKLMLLYGFSIQMSYLSMKTKSIFQKPRFRVFDGIWIKL